MKKTEEQKFLEVKEQLDYHRLPTTFPFEATDLLSKLISLIPRQRGIGKENVSSKINVPSNQLNDAVRLEIGKTVKQNNRLHSQLMNTHEEIQALKYTIEKHTINRMSNKQQAILLVESSKKREDQIFDELTHIKYKYNQLMDLIHEDPQIQKQYLKKLLKHKKFSIEETRPHRNPEENINENRKVGQYETVTQLQQKLAFTRDKLSNREAEIMRLQKKVQYDGLNMNKILKDFQDDRNQQKIQGLEQQITYLENQNKKMKQQIQSVRKKGGLKEALREQTRKNHKTIKDISESNRKLQRQMKQMDYGQQACQKQIKRQANRVFQQNKEIKDDYQLVQLTNKDLEKKIQFLQSQLVSIKNQLCKQQNNNANQEILVDQLRNTQQGGKILCQYETEDLKKKLIQAETLLSDYETDNRELLKKNKYFQEQGLIKSEAIQNLQRIVDELMKRENIQKSSLDPFGFESQSTGIQNVLQMKKDLSEMRHLLSVTKNDNIRLDQELQNLKMRYDQKIRQNSGFSDEISRLKAKIYQVKRLQGDHFETDKLIENLRIQLRKQQSMRNKLEVMSQQIESENKRLIKQVKVVNDQYQIYQKKTKNHLGTVNNEKADIVESNHLLEIRIRDKDRKLTLYQQKIDEFHNKLNILRDQINLLEDEKHSLMREKQKVQKHYQEAIRTIEQEKGRDIQFNAINEHQGTKSNKLTKQLKDKIQNMAHEIRELQGECQKLQRQKQSINREKISLIRQNDTLKMECNNLQRRIISADGN